MPHRLQRRFRPFRIPAFRQFIRLSAALSRHERFVLAGGLLACLAGVVLVATSWCLKATELHPAVGGTYIEGLLGEPHLVNPLFDSANDVDADLARLIYAGLFRINDRGEIVPDLAERFNITDDGKTVTVVLREGLRWQDGGQLTADDVRFTVNLIQDSGVGSPLRAGFQGVTVERLDEHTIRFTTERPLAVFLGALTVGILPEHLWSDVPPTHLALAELNLRPIGAGPYRFVGFTKDARGTIHSYTLERYAGYHHRPALLERLVFRFYSDLEQLNTAFNSREVDGVGTLAALADNAVTRRDVTRYPIHLPQTTAVFLNQRRDPALRDVGVRRALSQAIDRRAIIADVLRGGGEPVGGPLIPGFASEAAPPAPDAFDVASAERLLEAAKWRRATPEQFLAARMTAELQVFAEEKRKTMAATARKKRAQPIPAPSDEERRAIEERIRKELQPAQPYYRLRDGKSLVVTITTADAPELVAIAERIRDAWRAVGVRVDIEIHPLERVRGEDIPSRAYDALLFSQILGPDPDPFPFWHSSQVRHPGLNLSYFSNKAIDRLLEDARTTTDRAVRGQKYAAFQKLLAEERPAIFLTTPTFTYAVSSAVRGPHFDQLTAPADRFATITEWYTKTKRVWR